MKNLYRQNCSWGSALSGRLPVFRTASSLVWRFEEEFRSSRSSSSNFRLLPLHPPDRPPERHRKNENFVPVRSLDSGSFWHRKLLFVLFGNPRSRSVDATPQLHSALLRSVDLVGLDETKGGFSCLVVHRRWIHRGGGYPESHQPNFPARIVYGLFGGIASAVSFCAIRVLVAQNHKPDAPLLFFHRHSTYFPLRMGFLGRLNTRNGSR